MPVNFLHPLTKYNTSPLCLPFFGYVLRKRQNNYIINKFKKTYVLISLINY